MVKIKIFILGLLLGIGILSCQSMTKFIYKHYVYDYESHVLRGPLPENDLPDSICALSNGEHQCMAMKIDEFYKFKNDYEKRGLRISEL